MKNFILLAVLALSFYACEKEKDVNSDLVQIEVSSHGGNFAVEYTKKGQELNIEMESGSTYKDSYLLGDDEYIYVNANSTEQFPLNTELTILFYYEGRLIKDITDNVSVMLIISRADF